MSEFFSPTIVYLCFALAAICALVEAGFPTLGIATALSAAFGLMAVIGVSTNDLEVWPLLFAAGGVVISCVPLAVHRRVKTIEIIAGVSVSFGSVLFGIVNNDWITTLVAIAASMLFVLGMSKLFSMVEATRIAAPTSGMEALLGRTAYVRSWVGKQGTIQIDGAYWTCTGPFGLAAGSQVTITGHDGMKLEVDIAKV